jgi:hypothetical protein
MSSKLYAPQKLKIEKEKLPGIPNRNLLYFPFVLLFFLAIALGIKLFVNFNNYLLVVVVFIVSYAICVADESTHIGIINYIIYFYKSFKMQSYFRYKRKVR